jgi:hypothetical protein
MSHPGATDRLLGRPMAWRAGWIAAGIVAAAAALRGYQLGRLSFWYDEVVTMRLARASGPAALIDRLFRIDATRAPLHPLLLQSWVGLFGASEAAARALSVLFGIATVLLVLDIGRVAFDSRTGLWSAWLAALSPVLIVYSREARMYAWLVLVTCFCWRLLLGLRQGFTPIKAGAYVLSLAALVYSHPLGLLMMATLAVAGLLGLRAGFGSWTRWLVVHLTAAVPVVPWVVHYFDHPPEFLSGPLPLRFFLGTPIGFIGGNFAVLGGLVLVIAWGIVCFREDDAPCEPRGGDLIPGRWQAPAFLLLWLIVPPSALYAYSRLFQPIFGPQRYTVYVAPAYLILVALGLARLPAALRYPVAIALTILAASELRPKVYDPGLKADWRGFASALAAERAGPTLVIVAPSNEGRNVEVETARYYLPAGCDAIPLDEATPERLERAHAIALYLAVALRRGDPVLPPPEQIGPYTFRPERSYAGLMILRAEHGSARGGPGRRGGGSSSGAERRRPRDGPGLDGLEDRQHHGVEVPVEVGSGGAQGLLGGGPDAEAPLLELGRDRAEPQGLDDAERRLDLGVLREVSARVGLEVIGPDGRGPRAVRDPAAPRCADPERGLDRDAPQVGRDLQPGHDGADAPPVGDRMEFLGQRIGPALRAVRVEQTLDLREGHRGVEGGARLPGPWVGHHHILVAEEAQPGIERDLGGGAPGQPEGFGFEGRRQQAIEGHVLSGGLRIDDEPARFHGVGQLVGAHGLGLADPGEPRQAEQPAGRGGLTSQVAGFAPLEPHGDQGGPGRGLRGGQAVPLAVDPAEDAVVRADARGLFPLPPPTFQPLPTLLDRPTRRRRGRAIPFRQVFRDIPLGPFPPHQEFDRAARAGRRRRHQSLRHRAVPQRDPVGHGLTRRTARRDDAEE